MRPPIPPPTGDVNVPAKGKRAPLYEGVFVYFHLGLGCALRKNTKELVLAPANILAIIFFSSVLTLILFPVFHTATLLQIWVLFLCGYVLACCFLAAIIALFTRRSKKTLALTPYGVLQIERTREIEIEWSRVLCIFNWSGDLFLCTFAGSTFIAREAFASREEAQQFLQIVRELRKTRGGAWRDEWSGKTFGQHS